MTLNIDSGSNSDLPSHPIGASAGLAPAEPTDNHFASSPVREGSDKRKHTEIAILGAGVAGLTAAFELSHAGYAVTVLDREPKCGGTHRSYNFGPYTYDSGSVFFEQNHPLFDMFGGIRENCPTAVRRQRRLAPDGRILHYPFEQREYLDWPMGTKIRALGDLVYHRLSIADPKDAESFCLARMGRTAYERLGLRHYITRFHQEPPWEIDAIFCHRRMKFVMESSRWSALAKSSWQLATRQKRKPREPLLVRPPSGFAAIYDSVRQQLEACGVTFMMNTPVERLWRNGKRMTIETGRGTIEADQVIGAVPLDAMHHMAFGESSGLESVDLLTLFVTASDIPGTDANVLFNFHQDGAWKRATVYSRIYGRALDREYFAVEITRRRGQTRNAEAAFELFRKDVRPFGVFSDDMELEGFDVIDSAYPLYRKGYGDKIQAAVARLTDFGIASVGRQGRFEYLPISAQVIARTRAHLQESGFETKPKSESKC